MSEEILAKQLRIALGTRNDERRPVISLVQELTNEAYERDARLAQVHLDKAEYDALKNKLAVCIEGQRAQEGLTKIAETERNAAQAALLKLGIELGDWQQRTKKAKTELLQMTLSIDECDVERRKAEARLARYEQAAKELPEEPRILNEFRVAPKMYPSVLDYIDKLRDALAATRVERDDFHLCWAGCAQQLKDAIEDLKLTEAKLAAARAQLPAGMQDCTILFKQCDKGHGWLTATNWVQHGCLTCAVEVARAQERTIQSLLGAAILRLKELGDTSFELPALLVTDASEPNTLTFRTADLDRKMPSAFIGGHDEPIAVGQESTDPKATDCGRSGSPAPAAPDGYAHVPMGPVGATYPDKLDRRQGPYRRRKDVVTPHRRRIGKLSRRVMP